MLTVIASWLTGLAGPFLLALLTSFVRTYLDRKRLLDAAAEDQRSAQRTADEAAANRAREITDDLAKASDDDVRSWATRWMRGP